MNLNPRVSSKRWAALISPIFPSLIRSGKVSPWFWYCLATETTKRKLALVRRSRAILSPDLIRWASSTSSSAEIKSTLPISCKYLSNEAVSLLVTCLVILSCLIYLIIAFNFQLESKYGRVLLNLLSYFFIPSNRKITLTKIIPNLILLTKFDSNILQYNFIW